MSSPVIAPLWGVPDVARYCGVPVQTVYRWRARDKGPAPLKIGRHLRFEPDVVVAWARQQRVGGAA